MTTADRPVLERLFQYYLYDMSEYAGWPLSDNGSFSYPDDLLLPYWERQDHHPYFIICDGEVAGFCLLRPTPQDLGVWDMGQFFILRKFRRRNLGKAAFDTAISLHPGLWQVRVLCANEPAYQFWKTVITVASKGDLSEYVGHYHGLEMTYFKFQTIPNSGATLGGVAP